MVKLLYGELKILETPIENRTKNQAKQRKTDTSQDTLDPNY